MVAGRTGAIHGHTARPDMVALRERSGSSHDRTWRVAVAVTELLSPAPAQSQAISRGSFPREPIWRYHNYSATFSSIHLTDMTNTVELAS